MFNICYWLLLQARIKNWSHKEWGGCEITFMWQADGKGWQSQKGCSWIYCKFGARMPNMFKPSNTLAPWSLRSNSWLAQGMACTGLHSIGCKHSSCTKKWSRTPPLQKGEMPCRYHDDSKFAFRPGKLKTWPASAEVSWLVNLPALTYPTQK